MTVRSSRDPLTSWNGQPLHPGQDHDVKLAVSESYSGMTINIPIRVKRGVEDGPTVFLTAALHGDEINGTGAVRELLRNPGLSVIRGTVVFVPVLNILAFDRHSRYLPDRRDLNRSFPGSETGSLASRMARTIFDAIVLRCDYGIDLHTAALRRTNYPNVRGDLSNPRVRQLAQWFGGEVIMNSKGPLGSLRREATASGCPTLVMEGGEVWKVEPGIVKSAVRGVKNVLRNLNMLTSPIEQPDYQIVIERSKWVRADQGGFLQFHVHPGEIVSAGQPLATNTNFFGDDPNVIEAPFDAVVIGMTTLPTISPGEPVCNLGRLPAGLRPDDLRQLRKAEGNLDQRLTEQLSSSLLVVEP